VLEVVDLDHTYDSDVMITCHIISETFVVYKVSHAATIGVTRLCIERSPALPSSDKVWCLQIIYTTVEMC